jgi:exopolysaccharide production protein ExoQ
VTLSEHLQVDGIDMTQTRSSAPLFDKWTLAPLTAFVYSSLATPLIGYLTYSGVDEGYGGPNLMNQLAWPIMAGIAIAMAGPRLGKLSLPPPARWLFICLALAAVSTVWSVKPNFTLIRCIQQTTLITAIAVTPMLADRPSDLIRPLFLCFAVGVILNLSMGGRTIADGTDIGYQGLMTSKNNLGQYAGVAVLLAAHEIFQRGARRALGLVFIVLSILLVVFSESKTSLALTFLCPALAGLMLFLKKTARVSTLVVTALIMFFCIYFRSTLAWYVFHDVTFTGRTVIWDFVGSEIDHRPLLGWGFLAFWLTGSDSVAMLEAPGWVKTMPHAHNGYVDFILQLGYVGFACLVMLISTTIVAIERIAKQDFARGWMLLSITLFIIFNNHLESSWMHSGDFLWVVFVMVCAEASKGWQLAPHARPAGVVRPSQRPRPAGPGAPRRFGSGPVRPGRPLPLRHNARVR